MEDKLCFDSDWEYGCNKCVICDGDFKHSRMWIKEETSGLFVLREKLCHYHCKRLLDKIKKKKEELEKLELELLVKKYFIE